MHNKDTIKARRTRRQFYQEWCAEDILDSSPNAQNVFTPYDLCYDIIRKLETSVKDFSGKEFFVFNLEFADVLIYDFGVSPEKILFYTDCKEKIIFAEDVYEGVHCDLAKFTRKEIMDTIKSSKHIADKDKFDVVIGNPPYQGRSGNKGAGNTLWDKFVEVGNGLVSDGGSMAFIHPSLWRKPGHSLRKIIMSNQIDYLEIHDEKDGLKKQGTSER